MLSDVQTGSGDLAMTEVLETIAKGNTPSPYRIAKGLYVCNHWSFEHVAIGITNEYPSIEGLENSFGVCDSPGQFMAKFGKLLESDTRKFVVSFVKISRDEQDSDGGWRWHKWGPYVGAQEPTTEYLHDEPLIELVYTFHVYEVA